MPAPVIYFALQQRTLARGGVSTAAVWSCGLCTNVISGMGGPGGGELCQACGDDLLAGRLRGALKREPVAVPARPVRLRLSRRSGFDLQQLSRGTNGLEAVSVARPGPWGNPFHATGHTKQQVVDAHRRWLTDNPEGRLVAWRAAEQLRGKNLACWCPLDGPCHATTLLEIANA